MDHKRLSEIAASQLDRVLAFFPRADAKGSVLLAVDTGMLAVLASNFPTFSSFDYALLLTLVPVLSIGVSLWHLYEGAFPTLEGGQDSLIYFRETSKRTEVRYVEEFTAQSEEAYLKDVLGQVWRNSAILKEKFDHISAAFNWTALSIVPWVGSLVLLAVHYPSKSFLLK
jgi:hypothetical protein